MPENNDYHPTYKVLTHAKLLDFLGDKNSLIKCMLHHAPNWAINL